MLKTLLYLREYDCVRMFVLNMISFLNKLLLKYYQHLGTQTIPQLINAYSINEKYKKQICD